MLISNIIYTALLLSSWGNAFLAPRSISRGSSRTDSFYYMKDLPLILLKMNEESSAKKKRASNSNNRSTGGKGFADTLQKLQNKSFTYSGSVRPGKQSPQRVVTDPTIVLPDYALDGKPKKQSHSPLPWMIEVKTPKEIELMRAAGRCAREVLDIAGQAIQPGVTTDEIDALVHEETLKVCKIICGLLL
jgi:hypothetical protein